MTGPDVQTAKDAETILATLDHFWNVHPDESPRITHARALALRLAARVDTLETALRRIATGHPTNPWDDHPYERETLQAIAAAALSAAGGQEQT